MVALFEPQPDWDTGTTQVLLSSSSGPFRTTLDSAFYGLHDAVKVSDRSIQDIDSRIIPLVTTGVVCAVLGTYALIHRLRRSREQLEEEDTPNDVDEPRGFFARKLKDFGGLRIALFLVARLVAVTTLFGLSVRTLLDDNAIDGAPSQQSAKEIFSQHPEVSLTVSSAIAALFILTAFCLPTWRTSTTRGSNIILLSASAVYFYRDLWPFATYNKSPLDLAQGPVLWVKIGLMIFSSVFVPLFIPRKYVPVDPKDPMPATNPEQTCSIFSLIFFFYLDPILYKAAASAHLSWEELPPLQDTDYVKHTSKRAFKFLDPFQSKSKRHFFFSLMRVFRTEYCILSLMCVFHVIAQFAFPVSINRILKYIETGGEEATIKPWVWVIVLMSGPLIRTLSLQWYLFLTTRSLCRAEGIMTQLIFNHSLRIRLKAEVPKGERGTSALEAVEGSTAVPTPDTASVNTETGTGNEEGSDDGDKDKADKKHSLQPSSSSTLATHSAKPSTSKVKALPSLFKKSKDKEKPVHSSSADNRKKASNLVGKINNLVTSDLQTITDARDFLFLFVSVPVQITFCIVFLYKVLGWSAFVGLAAILALGPVPSLIAKLMRKNQATRMKMTDARIQDVTEAVHVLRMIKLFGWEHRVSDRIQEKRDEEIKWIRKIKMLEYLIGVVNQIVPVAVMLITYATFTTVMHGELNASIVFSTVSVFSMLRMQLARINWQINNLVQGKVSLDRMQEFLRHTELLDEFTETDSTTLHQVMSKDPHDERAGFRNIEFSWSSEDRDGSLTPSSRKYRLRFNEELIFQPGVLNMIIGPTGSGKTSILMALLGEMHAIPRGIDSWYNLPRQGGVAYAAQESWVQNATIRDNILFGSPYDEVRYKKVIRQCALERDLELFEAGDKTEVGERGLTLSGGQKARITLARAVYSSAKIVLLDDILAALDVHTSTWIVNKCLKGDLLRGRTVILVTHNVALVGPLAHFVVTIADDGSVQFEKRDVLLTKDDDDQIENAESDKDAPEASNEDGDVPKKPAADGKLVLAEEVAQGHVTWKSFSLFLNAMGGDHKLVFFSVYISTNFLLNWNIAFQTWWMGHWGSQYEGRPASEVNAIYYLSVSTGLVFTLVCLYMTYSLIFISGALRASKKIHKLLIESVLMSTLRWLDATPTGRIITRCTQDIRAVDVPIPGGFNALTDTSAELVTKFCVVIIFTPVFMAPAMTIAALGFLLGNRYLKAQLSVRREMSNAKAPVLSHFTAALNGLVSVRAYGAQPALQQESFKRIDHYVRIARISWNLNRWIAVRIDLLGSVFIASLAIYLIYGSSVGAANTGFSLNMAIDFATMILWWVRIFNDFEVQSNSLERIQAYVDIEHEPEPTEAGKPPAAWPTSGDLRVENLSARYSVAGPKVLHNLSFHIKSGERIGVVGRTGSGKSSLTLSLLRCIITEGTVFYDNIPTNKINLDALRANVTIIPQTPELLSGTLRRNLDPFEQHDDAVLNDALRSAGLFSLQQDLGEGRLSLDSEIASGGSNLSVGQRQVLALARAIVRQSKLLILDEATSAIDYKTDAIIQSTLREQLGPDVTVITVAHRLQTIMDADRIMVLDGGRLVEFDSPKVLLNKEGTLLKALVDESKDKDILYAMAEGKSA